MAAINAKESGPVVGVFVGVPLLICLIVHLLRGATCKCWIQTGINKERLVMFRRVREAQKFWKKLEPELVNVQGPFSLEEMEREGTFVEKEINPDPPPVPERMKSELI